MAGQLGEGAGAEPARTPVLIGLFTDLSTRVGWSLWKGPADSSPRFGTFALPKVYDQDNIAGRTLPLRFWLREMLKLHRPKVFAFESPFLPADWAAPKPVEGKMPFRTNAATLRLQIALATEVETTAKECEVAHVLEVATSSAKVALAGTARLGDRKKAAMVTAAMARGWAVADDHQADAGAVGLVAYQSLGYDTP